MSQTDASESRPAEPLPKPAKRRRWLSVLLGLVIFGSGFVVGAGVMGIGVRNWAVRFLHHPELGPPAMAALLKRKLDLTDSQTSQVEVILRQRQAALVAIRRQTQPAVETQLDLLESQVSEVLNPDQQRRWHEWLDAMRSTWVPPPPTNEADRGTPTQPAAAE